MEGKTAADVEFWTRFWVEDIGVRSRTLARKYATKFVEEAITEEIICYLNEEDLVKLEILKIGHRMRLRHHVKEITKKKNSNIVARMDVLEDCLVSLREVLDNIIYTLQKT